MQPAKFRYLRRFAALCSEHRLKCAYVRGPIVESVCSHSDDYLREVNRLIDTTGLERAAGTPRCLPYADVGDTADHVRPGLRREYPRRYFERISARD